MVKKVKVEEMSAEERLKYNEEKRVLWLESIHDFKTGVDALGALIVLTDDTWGGVGVRAGSTKQRMQKIKKGYVNDIYADFLADCCEAMGYQLCIVKKGEIAPDKCMRIRGSKARWTL